MKKIIMWMLVLALLVGIMLTGCAAPAPVETGSDAAGDAAAKETIRIYVLMPNAGDPYFQNKSYGYSLGQAAAEDEFPGVTVEVKLFDAGGYQNASAQVAQMEDAIQSGVDGIVLTPCDSEALVPVTKQALAAGIVVINDDIKVNTQCTSEVRENSYRAGQRVGMWLANEMGYKGNVLLMKGPAGADLFVQRGNGILDVLKNFENIKILDEQFQQDDVVAGKSTIEDWIERFGKDIDALYIHGSVQAVAAAESFKAAGFNKGEVKIVSFDFTEEANEYLADGWIAGLVPAQPVKIARTTVLFAARAIMGVEVPQTIFSTDDIPVSTEDFPTFDNSEAMAPAGWTPKLS